MTRTMARYLTLALLAGGTCLALGNFLFNYNLYRVVPTTLGSSTTRLGGDGVLTTPGFLDMYLGTIIWAAAAFVGLYAFLLLPTSPRTPKRGAARQLARLVGLVMILIGAFTSCGLLMGSTVGLLGVLGFLLGIVPFLCLPIGDSRAEQPHVP